MSKRKAPTTNTDGSGDGSKKPRTVKEIFSENDLSEEDLSEEESEEDEYVRKEMRKEREQEEYERKEREQVQDRIDKLSVLEEINKSYDTGAYKGSRIVVQRRRRDEELFYGYQSKQGLFDRTGAMTNGVVGFGYNPDEDKKYLSIKDKYRTMCVVKADVYDPNNECVGHLEGYLFKRPCFKFARNTNSFDLFMHDFVKRFCDTSGKLRPPINAWSTNEKFVHPMLCESASEGGLFVVQKVEVKHRGKALGIQLLTDVLVALKDKWSLSILEANPIRCPKWAPPPPEAYNREKKQYDDEEKLIKYNGIVKQIRSAYASVGFIQLGHSENMFLTAERFFQPVASSTSTSSSSQGHRTRLTREQVDEIGVYVDLNSSDLIFKGVNKQLRDLVDKFCKVAFKIKSKTCAQNPTVCREVPADVQVCPGCNFTTFNDVERPDMNLQQFIQAVQKLQQAGATLHASRSLFRCVDLVKKIGATLFDVEGFETIVSALLTISTHSNEINQVRGGDELESILHFAASSNGTKEGEQANLDLLSVLVKLGADVTMKDSQGYQPIDIAYGRDGDVEAMLAVTTPAMRSIVVDGWMTPVVSAVLSTLCNNDISSILCNLPNDTNENNGNSCILGKVYQIHDLYYWTHIDFIPSATLKRNSEGLCINFVLGYAYVCSAIIEVMKMRNAPTLACVRAYIDSQNEARNFSWEANAPVTRKEADYFFNNGGKIQYALDALFHEAQEAYVEKNSDSLDYEIYFEEQVKDLQKTPFDEVVFARYGYLKCCCGAGENMHSRAARSKYLESRGPFQRSDDFYD